jgi:hypothetical protein
MGVSIYYIQPTVLRRTVLLAAYPFFWSYICLLGALSGLLRAWGETDRAFAESWRYRPSANPNQGGGRDS